MDGCRWDKRLFTGSNPGVSAYSTEDTALLSWWVLSIARGCSDPVRFSLDTGQATQFFRLEGFWF